MVSASSEVSSSLEEDVSEAPELAEALGDDVTVVDDGVVECAAVSVESCELQPLRRVVPISTVVKRHIRVFCGFRILCVLRAVSAVVMLRTRAS